jgi:hypothetical protein
MDDSPISRWVADDPANPFGVHLRESGVELWALVGYARTVDGDDTRVVGEVARMYEVPEEAVAAALAYYRRHPHEIDAKLDTRPSTSGLE